jgi:hypothetical protein
LKSIKVLTVDDSQKDNEISKVDPYGGVVTFTATSNSRRCDCTVSSDELKVPGTRFKILRNLIKCLMG